MKKALSTVVAVAIGAGAYWFYQGSMSPIAKQRSLVRESLYDPDSAKFQNEHQSKRDKTVWCGELNAKNRMGGYVGFTRYVAYAEGDASLTSSYGQVFLDQDSGRGAAADPTSDAAAFRSKWATFCDA